MKLIIASMVLIVIGLVCAYSVYFETRPRDSLKAEELVAIDFCHFSGWIILGVGMIIGATATTRYANKETPTATHPTRSRNRDVRY